MDFVPDTIASTSGKLSFVPDAPQKKIHMVSEQEANQAGSEAMGREVAPLAEATLESKLPAVVKYPLALGATAVDIATAPFRAVDKLSDIVTGGAQTRAFESIDKAIPANGLLSNIGNQAAKMAVSPSTLLGGGVVSKLLMSPEKQAAQNLEKQLAVKIPASAAEMPVKKAEDLSLKDVQKGVNAPVEQIGGKVSDQSKVTKQGMPLLRDLDESENRIMSEPKAKGTIDFSEYAKQAELKKRDIRAQDANQLAGINATKAFKEIDSVRKDAGAAISKVIENNPDAKVSIANVKNSYLQMVNDRIGELKTGAIPADAQAAKESEDIGNMLLKLPDVIDAKSALNLKRNLQSRVNYTAEGQYKPANSLIDGITKQTARLIDQNMDMVLPGFKEANEQYGQVATIATRMSKMLGTEINPETGLTKHGSSIMKRALESNADSGISEVFRAVKELTGGKYDLTQDAAYAQIAMKYSGDARQARKALGGLPIQGVLPEGATVGAKILNATGKAAEKGREVFTGGKLRRIDDFYKKTHKLSTIAE